MNVLGRANLCLSVNPPAYLCLLQLCRFYTQGYNCIIVHNNDTALQVALCSVIIMWRKNKLSNREGTSEFFLVDTWWSAAVNEEILPLSSSSLVRFGGSLKVESVNFTDQHGFA